ncbi:MAG: hypothetical protein JW996_01000, partial [Candidatus Cloacimonetes bacterium]|nr:hypothetical protein [Candidatus Cloacimonadota bacterium]
MNLKKNLIDSIDWRNIRLMIFYCLIITLLLSFIFMASKARFEFRVILVTATYSFSIGFSIYFIMSIFSLEIRKKYLRTVFSLIQIIFASIVGLMIANLFFMLFFSQSK